MGLNHISAWAFRQNMTPLRIITSCSQGFTPCCNSFDRFPRDKHQSRSANLSPPQPNLTGFPENVHLNVIMIYPLFKYSFERLGESNGRSLLSE
mgnify:CR=1 FL=1